MLKSKELRVKAWESLKGKYWMALLASLITGAIYSLGEGLTSLSRNLAEIPASVDVSELDSTMVVGGAVISGIALVLLVIGVIFGFFVGNVAMAGACNYYIKNTDSKPSLSDAFSTFKVKYTRNVGTLLLRDVKTILWTFLFIIPGIIKSYEYAIIPYILADDPEISSKDAFKKAKAMMTGNKWRLFKLNFSFIGWELLTILTLGLGMFFLVPYIEAANAEFYVELKNKSNIYKGEY